MRTSRNLRSVYFSETKAPAGCLLTERGFSEHISREFAHFTEISKSNVCFFFKCDFDDKNQVKVKKVLKTKMVPTVHTNIFYELDFEISELNHAFLTKTPQMGFSKNWALRTKIKFWDSKWTSGLVFKTEIVPKHIPSNFWPFPTHFSLIKTRFLMEIGGNPDKSRKINKNHMKFPV